MYGLHNLSNKERDLYLFAETAGLSMNPRILRCTSFRHFNVYKFLYFIVLLRLIRILLELLQENATPASIIQVSKLFPPIKKMHFMDYMITFN